MRVLCFEFRILEVPYFMDVCTIWEINDLIEFLPYCDRNMWESQRLNAYMTAQVNSTKRLTMQDICKFKWEDEDTSQNTQEITDDDIKRLSERATQWEQLLQTQDN